MKKVFSILFALALIAGMSFAQVITDSTIFNLSMTIDKYIEVMPGPTSWNFGTSSYAFGYPNVGREQLYGNTGSWDLAYANCPFKVTISGENLANEHKPRFARLEEGSHSGGYDTLPTFYEIWFMTNGEGHNLDTLFYGVWLQNADQFPHTRSYAETPHNGQVKMEMRAYVNSSIASESTPLRTIAINPAFTWQQSADAGTYACSMVVTLTAL
jgi:hypothetical protein